MESQDKNGDKKEVVSEPNESQIIKKSPSDSPRKLKRRSKLEKQLQIDFNPDFIANELTLPSTSRYGRTRKRKNDDDYYNTDDIVQLCSAEKKFKPSPSKQVPLKSPLKTTSPQENIKNSFKNPTSSKPICIDLSHSTNTETSPTQSTSQRRIPTFEETANSIPQNSFAGAFLAWINPTDYPKCYVQMNRIQSTPTQTKSKSHLSYLIERNDYTTSIEQGLEQQNDSTPTKNQTIVQNKNTSTKKKPTSPTMKRVIKVTPKKRLKIVLTKCENAPANTKKMVKKVKVVKKCNINIGDLYWGRVPSHPFWPCMVTVDPISKIYCKQKCIGRSGNQNILHVTFFGDKCTRGWVAESMMKPFLGLDEFQKIRDSFTPEQMKKTPNYCSGFNISQNKQAKWKKAVHEAESCLDLTKEKRLDYFQKRHTADDLNSTPKIRRSLSLSESLYESLFSDDSEDKGLNVSEIVTACLDDMVSKTGNKKIQQQSHMERWLMKAKSPYDGQKNDFSNSIFLEDSNVNSSGSENVVRSLKMEFELSNFAENKTGKRSKATELKNAEINDSVLEESHDCIKSEGDDIEDTSITEENGSTESEELPIQSSTHFHHEANSKEEIKLINNKIERITSLNVNESSKKDDITNVADILKNDKNVGKYLPPEITNVWNGFDFDDETKTIDAKISDISAVESNYIECDKKKCDNSVSTEKFNKTENNKQNADKSNDKSSSCNETKIDQSIDASNDLEEMQEKATNVPKTENGEPNKLSSDILIAIDIEKAEGNKVKERNIENVEDIKQKQIKIIHVEANTDSRIDINNVEDSDEKEINIIDNIVNLVDNKKQKVNVIIVEANTDKEINIINVEDNKQNEISIKKNPDSSSLNDESSKSSDEVKFSHIDWSTCSPDSSSDVNNDVEGTSKDDKSRKTNSVETESEQIPEISSTNDSELVKANDVQNTKYDDVNFQKYLKNNQDKITDENAHLTELEIIKYLYNAWKYANDIKTNDAKNAEDEKNNLVTGAAEIVQAKPKKIKKKNKIDKLQNIEMFFKDKPKRLKALKCYVDTDSDSDIDDKLLNIALKRSLINKNDINKVKKNIADGQETLKCPKLTIKISQNDIRIVKNKDDVLDHKADQADKKNYELVNNIDELVDNIDDNIVDDGANVIMNEDEQFEYFMERLKHPKPNLFKGLAKEKVCEICETPSNLIKCTGPCCGVFHLECSNSKADDTEADTKKTRKRRKKVGRPKRLTNDKNSIDNDNDIDFKLDFDINLDDFESKAEKLCKELLEKQNGIDYDSSSTDDEIDWYNMAPGNCEIVDIKLKIKPNLDNFKCYNCVKYGKPLCFVCKSVASPKGNVECVQKCNVMHCIKYYHLECLEVWPQTQFNSGAPSMKNKKVSEYFEALTCPRHVCHTCVCDDPRGCKTRFTGDKLARCTRCPAVYHTFNQCIPAGTEILTATQIICPRHYDNKSRIAQRMNTSWCFICASGGSLICCDSCPTSVHANCLNISPPEGGFMCEDCETGRLPLYGEIVWTKLGVYRWWPAFIIHPSDIPDNISALPHFMTEFVVRFFPNNEFYWVHRGRVFPYQEGDKGSMSSRKTTVDSLFVKAVSQAQKAYEIVKALKETTCKEPELESSLLPPHYVKLKVNKPIGSVASRRIDVDPDDALAQCQCSSIEPCGPDTDCLNRMLLTECGPNCVTGDLCNNRNFEKRLYPKLVPYRTAWGGWGLKTLQDIRKGQFVIEYVGELIDEEEFRRRMKRKHETRDENYYFLTLDKDRMIDAGPKGNVARFMNNSCDPNCETQKWTVLGDVRVGLFAIKDIPAGSEVTFNYNLECASVEKKRCLCGAKCCSGYIGLKPKLVKAEPPPSQKPEKRKYVKKNLKTEKKRGRKPKIVIAPKPRELTEIEKDLMIIQNATNGLYDSDENNESQKSVSAIENGGEIQNGGHNPLKRKLSSISLDIELFDKTKKIKLKNGLDISLRKKRGRPRKMPSENIVKLNGCLS